MTFDIYNSVPINTKISEIRLIELLPGRDDESISCVFHRRTLGSLDLEFRALSYTWGTPTSTSVIFIKKVAFNIRQNLWLFLKQERYRRSFGLIWIDALSIDQSNTGERNHQVALMKEIYSKVVL
jgi:hypothetical protein